VRKQCWVEFGKFLANSRQHVFCLSRDQGIVYLSFRFWIGMWLSLLLLLMVAFDLSALVRYITRFTEESFAILIALIFIFEAFKKLIHILDDDLVNLNLGVPLDYNCTCLSPLVEDDNSSLSTTTFSFIGNIFFLTFIIFCLDTLFMYHFINWSLLRYRAAQNNTKRH